jgi:hypothetical protein
MAKELRERSNVSYKERAFAVALKGYNQSLMFGSPNSPTKEWGLSFGNRSALLFQTKQYASSLMDISRALTYGPQELVPKLMERVSKCCHELGLDPNGNDWKDPDFLQQLTQRETEEDRKRTGFVNDLFTLKNPHSLIPTAEECISIESNSQRGRHVITNKEVQPGITILQFISRDKELTYYTFSSK